VGTPAVGSKKFMKDIESLVDRGAALSGKMFFEPKTPHVKSLSEKFENILSKEGIPYWLFVYIRYAKPST